MVVMPRYYFNIYHDGPDLDDEGLDLPDHDAAREDAVAFTSDMLKVLGEQFKPGDEWRLEVADETKAVLFVIRVQGEAVKAS